MRKFISYAGWYGVVAILAAYMLVSFELITVRSLSYQLLNLTGSVGIVLAALSKKDMQPVVLNIVWAAIAAVAITQLVLQ